MNVWISIVSWLGQAPAGGGGGGAPTQPAPTGGMGLLLALPIALIVFMILSQRSQQKRRERDRQALFESISKNDRVLTIGGVLGTVHSVKGNEVVLKVDESTNTKMTFVKSAIQRVVVDDADAKLETN